MDNKGYGNIPSTLYECITFIVRALPIRSVPTFIELLVGAIRSILLLCEKVKIDEVGVLLNSYFYFTEEKEER